MNQRPSGYESPLRLPRSARNDKEERAGNDKKDEAQLARELNCSVSAFSHFVVGEGELTNWLNC